MKILLISTCCSARKQGFRELNQLDKYRVRVRGIRTLISLLEFVDGQLLSIILYRPEKAITMERWSSLVVSLVHLFINDPLYPGRVKKLKKRMRKCFFEKVNMDYSPYSESMWLVSEFLSINIMDRTRGNVYRVATLTQTRNTGLPPLELMEVSIEKWVRSVTEPPIDIPDLECHSVFLLDLKEQGILFNREKIEQAAKLLVTNHGSYESPRRLGGKFTSIRNILNSGLEVKKINLYNGFVTDEVIPRENIGDYVFHHCLHGYHGGKRFPKMRASVIFEPGFKTRIVTVSQIEHTEILAPFNKMGIAALGQIPELSAGVSQTRHGWQFVKRMSYSDPKNSWIESANNVYLLSSDLEESTDHINWHVSRQMLRAFGTLIGVPPWYLSVCIDLLNSPRLVKLPNGKVITTVRCNPMGDPLTKVVLSLIAWYCRARSCQEIPGRSLSSEVGDDLIHLSDTRTRLVRHLEILRIVDMRVSEVDTYISQDWGHYAEEYLCIPQNRYNQYQFVRVTRFWGRINYVDYPRIRLVLSVSTNEDMKLSSTSEGKYLMFGWEGSLPVTAMSFLGHNLASVFQTLFLEGSNMYINPYAPTIMGGCSKTPEWGHITNVTNYFRWARLSPKYLGLFKTQMEDFINFIESNVSPTEDLYCYTRRYNKHLSFSNWIMSFSKEALPGFCQDHLKYDKTVVSRMPDTIYKSMIRGGLLVPETQVRVTCKILEFYQDLLTGSPDTSKLVKFLQLDDVQECTVIDIEFLASKFYKAWENNPQALRFFLKEALYSVSVIDAAHDVIGVNVDITLTPEVYTPGYKSLGSLEETEIDLLYKKVDFAVQNSIQLSTLSSSLLDDDSILEQLFKENRPKISGVDRVLVLVTTDRKLCQRIANIGYKVYQMPTTIWLANLCDEDSLLQGFPRKYPVFVDTGSFNAWEERLFVDGVLTNKIVDDITDFQDQGLNLEVPLSFLGGFSNWFKSISRYTFTTTGKW